ncbi:MAG: hypothetical protein PF542_03610 [Nanoarchaeota archaeon]|jgi:hypothetical protein|nr:hypothetical protein [Nanoarchaeota archaeon]
MAGKAVKVSEENYLWLLGVASKIKRTLNRPVTINDTLNELRKKSSYDSKLGKISGSWKIAEDKAEMVKKEIKKGWKRWEIKSV